MKNRKINNKWFTIIEAVMTSIIIIIFFIWAYAFFNLQNKNISLFINEQIAKDLINESQEYFTYIWYDKIIPGKYWMYYVFNWVDNLWKIIVNQISENENTDETWKFINANWTLFIWYNKNAYKRIINVEDTDIVYLWQKSRKITINVWHKECDFSKKACNIKEFLVFNNYKYE